jgi:ABC-2 type transport system ATP-binding protein
MVVIETKDLKKTFTTLITRKKVHALQGVDLEIKRGEIFGLLGPNGAGKTTLVKILLGICYASQGVASLFGLPVRRAASRAHVGYLPENHRYPHFLKGRQVMDYYAKLSGMRAVDREMRIPLLLEMVRMRDWSNTKMGKYSKGMQQRVGMAVAMVHDPDLLVLDEPTDGVDPIGRKEIRDILLELKERGKTIFLNSHLLSEVELICDRVAILNKGKVVTEGSVDELTSIGSVWSVTFESAPEYLRQLLVDKGFKLRYGKNEELLLDAPDVTALNGAIDVMRAEGALISAIIPQRLSLEEMFIDVINREGGAGVK